MVHTEWLPGVQLKYSVAHLCSCMAQWKSTANQQPYSLSIMPPQRVRDNLVSVLCMHAQRISS